MTSSGTWIRPVSDHEDGTLYESHYRLSDQSDAAVLDILRVQLAKRRPQPHQPENWQLTADPWERCGRLSPARAKTFLRAHMTAGPDLLGNRRDRVDFEYLASTPTPASLCLIEPAALRWRICSSGNGKRQTRAEFTLARTRYSLSVTDPVWEERLSGLPYGVHDRSAAGIADRQVVFLTVSLSEPFDGDCYKLVAAVIVL